MAKKIIAKKAKLKKAPQAKKAVAVKKKVVKAPAKAKKVVAKKAKPNIKVVSKTKPSASKKTKAIVSKKAVAKKVFVSKTKKAAKVVVKKTVKPVKQEIKKVVVAKKVAAPIKKTEAKPVINKSVHSNGKTATPLSSVKSIPTKNNKVAKPTVNTAIDTKAFNVNKNFSQIVKPINNGYVKPQALHQVNKAQTTVNSTQIKKTDMAGEKTRYSDTELAEFKDLILLKLEEKRKDFEMLKGTIDRTDDHGTEDTAHTFKPMEDGSDVMTKEEVAQLATRQKKIIQHLENALFRIENKTYGICRVTGKLIPKERLRSVPHATTTVEAKMSEAPQE